MMTIWTDFTFILAAAAVHRQIGYTEPAQPGAEVESCLANCLTEARRLLNPRAVFQCYPVEIRNDGTALVGDNDVLHGVRLMAQLGGSEEVLASVLTVGPEIERRVQEYFEEGDPLSAMVLDAIGTVALLEMQEQFWARVVKLARQQGVGLVGPFSPGIGDWPVEEQAIIHRLAGGESIGIHLTSGWMMLPLKSVSQLCGLGAGLPLNLEFDQCQYCDLDECRFGKGEERCISELVRITLKIPAAHEGQNGKALDVVVQKGANLLHVLQKVGFTLEVPCGGQGTCGKCRVLISVASLDERKMANGGTLAQLREASLTAREIAANYRLACQTQVEDGMTVVISWAEGNAVEDGVEYGVDHEQRHLALAERETVSRQGYEAGCQKKSLGLAIDLGTTTVAGYLLDLETGCEIAHTSHLNPQRRYGADVISRVHYANAQAAGAEVLQSEIIGLFNRMIDELTSACGYTPPEIDKVVVVGNTVMMHLLLGYPTASLGQTPYSPAYTGIWEGLARDLGLRVNPAATLLIPPGIAGFVGADMTAGILASALHTRDEQALLLDIGTNGEMALANRHVVWTCATAAGPAFEGAGIRYGMAGLPGAISAIQLREDPGYTVIGGGRPTGICGSGILDAIAELLDAGVLDESGRLHTGDARVIQFQDQPAWLVAEGAVGGEPILLTQQDIRQVQLAKGAIRAGIEILLRHAGLQRQDVRRVYLAGGFGNYLRVASALRIGLCPAAWQDRISPIGNSAGAGAKMLLLAESALSTCGTFLSKTGYVELAEDGDFQDLFIEHLHLSRG